MHSGYAHYGKTPNPQMIGKHALVTLPPWSRGREVKMEKDEDKRKRELWGAFQELVVEAGPRASCSLLKVPQYGSISECFRLTQVLLLRALGCLGAWSGVQSPSRSGGLRVPAWAAPLSAREGREEGQGRRAGAPW